jgi:acyl dehydratase
MITLFEKGNVFIREFSVNGDVYFSFMNTFKDKNPLHVDAAFATAKGFKGPVMHGNILNGFLSYFVGECLPTKNVIIHSQEIQFKQPVYLDEKLKLEAVVDEVHESVNAVVFKFTFKNEASKTVSKGKIQIGILQ